MAAKGRGLFSLYIYIENFKKIFLSETTGRFQYNFAKMLLWWSSTKIVQAVWIRQKTWPPGGRGLFTLYIYIENFKNLLVWNHWTDFNIILHKCYFGDPLLRCSSHLDSSKNTAAMGRGLFSLYIYIENFKNLLVRNHWTDFNIILQKCSFDAPLLRLFKPFGFVKKHGRHGRGLFSIYICIENFKILLVRNHLTDLNITWQKCFLGDTLPRLFKQSWFVKKKKTWLLGMGLIFPIYLNRKL